MSETYFSSSALITCKAGKFSSFHRHSAWRQGLSTLSSAPSPTIAPLFTTTHRHHLPPPSLISHHPAPGVYKEDSPDTQHTSSGP